MSYFAAALVSLLGAELLMAAGFGYPAAGLRTPDTLVLVHLAAIGWLSLLMCGALFQFVPVLIARPLHSNALTLPTLVSLLVGLAALLLGFLQLGGHIAAGIGFFLPVKMRGALSHTKPTAATRTISPTARRRRKIASSGWPSG
jgi:hypothetical protein